MQPDRTAQSNADTWRHIGRSSRSAVRHSSQNGIHFDAQPQILGKTYWRAFSHAGATYGFAMPGQFYRSEDGFTNFETGPKLFGPDMRHAAPLLRGDTLHVFWSRVGDAPERILLSTIDVSGPWEGWFESAPAEVLRPERLENQSPRNRTIPRASIGSGGPIRPIAYGGTAPHREDSLLFVRA